MIDLKVSNCDGVKLHRAQITMGYSAWNIVNIYASNETLIVEDKWGFQKKIEELPGDRLVTCADFSVFSEQQDN